MRIVAGAAKGRRLTVPAIGVRPTPDRVREALFSSLADVVVDADMLDLFAGSGAVGLEALSRGARSVTFVENDSKTAAVVRQNIDTVGLDGAHLNSQSAAQFLQKTPQKAFTLVFLDAPYSVETATIDTYLAALTPHLADQATVVVERDRKQAPPTFPHGFDAPREKRYGSVKLYRALWRTDGSVTTQRTTGENP